MTIGNVYWNIKQLFMKVDTNLFSFSLILSFKNNRVFSILFRVSCFWGFMLVVHILIIKNCSTLTKYDS